MAAFTNFIPVGSIIEFGIKNEQAQILEVLKNGKYFIRVKNTNNVCRVDRTDIRIQKPFIRYPKDSFMKVHKILAREPNYSNSLFHSSKYSLIYRPEDKIKESYYKQICKNKIEE